MTGWAAAVEGADKLQEEHPDWQVRAVPRRDGPGVAAVRDGGGLCSVTGSVEEVRAVLVAAAEG
jgi:hypothetical protein